METYGLSKESRRKAISYHKSVMGFESKGIHLREEEEGTERASEKEIRKRKKNRKRIVKKIN